MTPDQMGEKAAELFLKRFHCSQAVLAVGLDKMGMQSPEAVRAMGLFGGGISGSGKVCGALAGAIALISLLYSRSRLAEKEDPRMWILGRMLDDRFNELTREFGGHNCKDIARVDWTDRDQTRDFYQNPQSRRQHCLELVGATAKALGEILEREALENQVPPWERPHL